MFAITSFTAQDAINAIKIAEGGDTFTNDPTDMGGATRWGITENLAKQYQSVWDQFSFNGVMSTLPEGLADYIYLHGFWNSLDLDNINSIYPPLAFLMFSIGVNGGDLGVAKELQRSLNCMNNVGRYYSNIVVDGSIGPGTISAITALNTKLGTPGLFNLTMKVFSLQIVQYMTICENSETQEKYDFGWDNRVIKNLQDFGIIQS